VDTDVCFWRTYAGVARVVPVAGTNSLAAVHGALRGRVQLAEDFDELPDDIAEAFGAR